MAGHSKWANIKHRKERADSKKGKAFSRSSKEIISAVKQSGPDPKSNPRLRLAIQKAREVNVPNDNIERVIKKASGADQADYFEMTYELYGYGGVGIILEIMTDNKNRISSEIRIATNKRGGTVAMPGAVVFNFDRKGILEINSNQGEEDNVFHAALDSGAEDFEVEEGIYIVTTAPTELYAVKEALAAKGIQSTDAFLELIPKLYVDCNEENTKANLDLIEWLDNIDDVDNVSHNMNIP